MEKRLFFYQIYLLILATSFVTSLPIPPKNIIGCPSDLVIHDGFFYASINAMNPICNPDLIFYSLPKNWQIASNISYETATLLAKNWPVRAILTMDQIFIKSSMELTEYRDPEYFVQVNFFIQVSQTSQYAPSNCDAQILIKHKSCPIGHLNSLCQSTDLKFGHYCQVTADDILRKFDDDNFDEDDDNVLRVSSLDEDDDNKFYEFPAKN